MAAKKDAESLATHLRDAYPDLLEVAQDVLRRSRSQLIEPHDLANEIFVRLLSDPLSDSSLFSRPRLLRIARDQMKRMAKRQRPEARRSNHILIPDSDMDSILTWDTGWWFAVSQRLHSAVNALEERDSHLAGIVELLAIQSLSRIETASILGIPTSQVDRDWDAASNLLNEVVNFQDIGELDTVDNIQRSADILLSPFTSQLYASLLEDTERLKSLTDSQFEELIADRFSAMGFGVELVGPTRSSDGGIDIIAWPEAFMAFPFLIAVHVKHHHTRNKTGVSAIRDFNGVLTSNHAQFHMGVVVTNTSFTADARWFANHNSRILRLRDLADLCRWMRNEFTGEQDWREIPREIEVAPGKTIVIPGNRT